MCIAALIHTSTKVANEKQELAALNETARGIADLRCRTALHFIASLLRMTRTLALITLAPIAILTACGTEPIVPPEPDPQDMFWEALSSHCGKAYAGTLVSSDTADVDFQGAEMVMHVSECSDDRIAVPFHVSMDGEWDRSRTWLITRTAVPHMSGQGETPLGLRLKHDHRHEDGEPDAVTMYGGDTADEGTGREQTFPVDDFSVEMFEREGLGASVTNVWTVEVDTAGNEGATFAYQLQRRVETGAPEDRFFRVEFDLSEEVKAPPPAWGW